jgi:hypothetical protein
MEKKRYEILFHEPGMTEYVKGRISGAMNVLTGATDKGYPWKVDLDELDCTKQFDATYDQYMAVMDWINTWYPEQFVGVREIE